MEFTAEIKYVRQLLVTNKWMPCDVDGCGFCNAGSWIGSH